MVSTRANDLDPSLPGGWAVVAAAARHHLHGGEPLMAGWDSEDASSVSATERLRAAWAVRLRPAAATEPEPRYAEPDVDPPDTPDRAS